MDQNTPFKIIASRPLDTTHTNIISLLYLPLIGPQAFSLYFSLYALIDRSHLRSPSYPQSFLLDILNLTPKTLLDARQKLEAVGLLDSYLSTDTLLYELYLPQSAETFIKDSPFAPYLYKNIGKTRFNELIQHFKITSVRMTKYDPISVSFSDIFTPAYTQLDVKGHYLASKQKAITITHPFNVDIVIDSLPEHLVHPTTKTKKAKDKLTHMAYIYDLNEETLKDLILKALNTDTTLDFDTLTKHCQKQYQQLPKHSFTKKTQGYDIDYFKTTHPKTIVEDLTGSHVPATDLRIIDRIITESDLNIEVLNVLIAYVLKELDNQFPVYNYFEKIIAEWKRTSIKTAEDAIEHIKKRKNKKRSFQKPANKYSKKLPKDIEVDWFDDYIKASEKEK